MVQLIENKKKYTLKTAEGQELLRDYIAKYNERIDESDPLSKKIGIDEALAITNIEEFIRSKSLVAEVIREALEIAFTCENFKTNSVFTFARQKLKKLNLNSIIRLQVENYIKFRMKHTSNNITAQKKNPNFENVTSFQLNGQTFYFNILTNEAIEGEELQQYLSYKKALIS